MKNFKIPARFTAYFTFVFTNVIIFSLLRLVFYVIYKPSDIVFNSSILRAFITGLRFDLRIAFLFALPLGIVLLLPARKWLRKITTYFYTLAFALLTLAYATDFGYYAYLTQRLDAYIIELASNTITSVEMVWQSYPVIKIALAFAIVLLVFYFLFNKLLKWTYSKPACKKQYWFAALALLITAAFVHGKVSQYPLRWSDAYFTNNSFISALSLNPLQNLYDTYKFAKKGFNFDTEKTREHYDIVADYLGVKNKNADTLNFERTILQSKNGAKQYNVVIILTESLSYDKTSFNDPELRTTPELVKLAQKGRLFTHFFTPTAGTARGVFVSITGLPDTSTVKTSSRNPLIVSQHTLINDLKGYQKFYFIGGSTSWGNIRGLLQYNIDGIKIFEEGAYKDVERNDVWGLSDLDMFRYAAKELTAQKEPFFAFLQTSGFHRPYTIPDDKGSFEERELDEDFLKSYGFSGNAEYNSMRFQDYAMGEFFRLIEKEPFYKDTIFFIYGDHGLTVHQSKNLPRAMLDLELTTNNTPLIVFGPGIKPSVDKKPASQVDITATMAGLLGIEYRETALGRNLFDDKIERGAFILNSNSAPLKIGFIEGDFYYTLWPGKEGLFKYSGNETGKDHCKEQGEKCQRMRALAQGLYETARYITFHH
ncbi:MAG: sulfatase-like hydrolase/transferase [Elusimicrobiota bacterium]|jgi:phosphoglycerol transferase MdoB-like AlkP superfamily enzyme|nr:sulfatase-like hydrolase/transferase [Elusimicrobiota bacterium]